MDYTLILNPSMISIVAGFVLGAGLLFLLVKYVMRWLDGSKQSDPQTVAMQPESAPRPSLTGLSWIIATTHRAVSQITGLVMSFATLIAIILSVICAVVGITIISYQQYGSLALTIPSALATFVLALLIENTSINALKTIRLANEEIAHAEQAHYAQIVKQMEEQFEEDTRDFAKLNQQSLSKDEVQSMQRAASLKQQTRKQFEKKRRGLMREQTRTARHNRRSSIPFAVTGIVFSASAGGLFWHTVLSSLPLWLNITVGTMFALAVSVTFVQSELLKRIKDEAIKEALQSGEMQATMLRQQSEDMVLEMVVDTMASVKQDPNTLIEMGTGIKEELKTTIQVLTHQATARLVTVEEVKDDVKLLSAPKDKSEVRQKKELNWVSKMEQSVIPLKYPRLRQKLDSLRSSSRVTISMLSLMDALDCSKKFIQYRIKSGALQVATHNSNLIHISSVIDWLQTADIPTKDEHSSEKTGERIPETDNKVVPTSHQDQTFKGETVLQTPTLLHVQESDKLSIALAALHINPLITDEELAPLLSLRRSTSARFWKIKAQEILDQEQFSRGKSLERVTTA